MQYVNDVVPSHAMVPFDPGSQQVGVDVGDPEERPGGQEDPEGADGRPGVACIDGRDDRGSDDRSLDRCHEVRGPSTRNATR